MAKWLKMAFWFFPLGPSGGGGGHTGSPGQKFPSKNGVLGGFGEFGAKCPANPPTVSNLLLKSSRDVLLDLSFSQSAQRVAHIWEFAFFFIPEMASLRPMRNAQMAPTGMLPHLGAGKGAVRESRERQVQGGLA